MKTLINKVFLSCLYFAMAVGFVSPCYAKSVQPKAKKIGIILPIEHQALREIVRGFQDTLVVLYKKPLELKTGNAEGDITLQRSIITQMRDADYDLIVPVATSVTQMTASLVHSKPILGLAVNMDDKKNNMVIVDDEIDKEQIIAFIHKVDPKLKHLVLVHSSLDKVFSEVTQVENACKSHHIVLRRFMIQSLADLYSVSQAMPPNTQAIFILKDSLVASGIDTLVQESSKRKIPLITSDDGTVKKGASFALGVHEKDIGIEGAKLAARILNGESPGKLATVKLTRPLVFVNSKSLTSADRFRAINLAAKQLHYSLEIIQ